MRTDPSEISPAGFVGGQGRTGQDIEDLAAGCLAFGVLLLVGILVGAICYLTGRPMP